MLGRQRSGRLTDDDDVNVTLFLAHLCSASKFQGGERGGGARTRSARAERGESQQPRRLGPALRPCSAPLRARADTEGRKGSAGGGG